MKNHLIRLSVLGFVGLFVLISGCATTRTRISILEGPKEWPNWVDKADAKSTKTHKAFSGESLKHATRQSAKEHAEKEAKYKAVDAMWGEMIDKAAKDGFAKGGLETDIIAKEIGEKMKAERKAKGIVRGDFVDYCVQRVQDVDETGASQVYWRAATLYMVDRNLVKEYLEEALNESKKAALDETRRKQIERGLELIDKISQEW